MGAAALTELTLLWESRVACLRALVSSLLESGGGGALLTELTLLYQVGVESGSLLEGKGGCCVLTELLQMEAESSLRLRARVAIPTSHIVRLHATQMTFSRGVFNLLLLGEH